MQIMVVFILSLPYEKDVFFYFAQRIINARNKKESVCITFFVRTKSTLEIAIIMNSILFKVQIQATVYKGLQAV